ncbi:hypothetical protein [Humisphaera borealis]|uniref:Uncharacterized protein n=1 Tax=Humisphaera borealis TaxID=2807512 RepID=A0A7M2WWI0_9BACT|nr:hypothetical protein [Humisphaera borealis]QOV89763.1 hypothetical protein IPV69_26870 [Humisphaera borealis]
MNGKPQPTPVKIVDGKPLELSNHTGDRDAGRRGPGGLRQGHAAAGLGEWVASSTVSKMGWVMLSVPPLL